MLAIADLAVKLELEAAFDTGFADVRRRRILAPLDDLEIRRGDTRNVADRMRGRIAVRIVTDQALADIDTGELVSAHGEPRGLLVGQVAEHDVLETPMRAHEACQRVAFFRVDESGTHELGERRVEVGHLLGRNDELPSRQVLRKHVAIAVIDEAARWREWLDAKAVTLR